jgi:hypothetical protein
MQVQMGNRAKKELPAPKQGKLQGDDRCYNALLQLCEEHPPSAGVRWQRQNLPTGRTLLWNVSQASMAAKVWGQWRQRYGVRPECMDMVSVPR